MGYYFQGVTARGCGTQMIDSERDFYGYGKGYCCFNIDSDIDNDIVVVYINVISSTNQ